MVIFDRGQFFCSALFRPAVLFSVPFFMVQNRQKRILSKPQSSPQIKLNIQDFVEMAEGHRPRWIDVLSRRQKESNKVRFTNPALVGTLEKGPRKVECKKIRARLKQVF